MARYLIVPLVLILALAALLLYVGSSEIVTLDILGKTYKTKLQVTIIGISVCIGIIIGLWSLAVWLWRLPTRMKTGFGRKREQNGLNAIEDAILAGENGDADKALKKAKRAHDLLQRPALTALISAKAAESAGEETSASTHYKALLDNPRTKVAGLRGLARIAFNKGDYTGVIKTARAAYEPYNGPQWAFENLFDAQIQSNDWDGALETLKLAERRKHVDKDKGRRMRVAILSAKAASLEIASENTAALEAASRAADIQPEFAPGTALAARLLAQNGDHKKAARLLEKAWSRSPHPALGLAYRDLLGNESTKVQTKRVNHLVKTYPAHRESLILLAENALHTQDGLGALQSLGGLLREEEPSARLCTLAASAEELLGNEVDAKSWLIRASTAPIESDWTDLDPNGSAFAYTEKDWRRLIKSYGENGILIHPRLETHQQRRAPINSSVNTASVNTTVENDKKTNIPDKKEPKALEIDIPPSPDDPGVSSSNDSKENLSKRLANLLGNTKS
ncbi:MAG: heme biosynthesis HemY N-terminal domain-containing protein [Robiginitomaculum sp.]